VARRSTQSVSGSKRRLPRRTCRTIAASKRSAKKTAERKANPNPKAGQRRRSQAADDSSLNRNTRGQKVASHVTGLYHAHASIGHADELSVEHVRDTAQEVVPIPSDQLLHRVSAGEAQAVQECIGRFGGLVWALARRSGLPEADLEDAVHEIFTELWHNGHKYDPQIASEAAFVAIIARRRLIDRRRRIGRRPTTQELTEFNSGAASNPLPANPDVAEEAAVAAKALETLSSEQQRVLRLSVYEGLSHELISRATGLPLGTVKTHARRGLLRLREMLASDTADGSRGETNGGAS
jgi:RNA polymerase sigma-70 factor (ECF subfamily)